MPLVLPVDLTRRYEAAALLQVETLAQGGLPADTLVRALRRLLADGRVLDEIRQAADEARPSHERTASAGVSASDLLSGFFTRQPGLAERLGVTPDLPGQMLVRADAREALEAARLANAAAAVLARHLGQPATGEADQRVAAARQVVQAAEAALAAEAVAAEDRQRWQAEAARQADIEARLARGRAALAEAHLALEAVRGLTLAGVLETSPPAAAGLDQIEPLRRQFLDARLLAERLAADLGPRHPKLIAARQAVDEARAAIGKALENERSRRQQETARLEDDLRRLGEEQARIAARPVSVAEQRHREREAALATAREALSAAESAARRAEPAPQVVASLTMPARAVEATATGLPLWLASLMGSLAALCLAAAALPGRRPQEQNVAGLVSSTASTVPQNEPAMATSIAASSPFPEASAALPRQSAVVASAPSNETAEAYAPLRFTSLLPVTENDLASFADQGQSLPATARAVDESAAAMLEELLLSQRQPAGAHPLPSLLAGILDGEGDAAPRHRPMAANDDLLQLRRDLARLRAEVTALSQALAEPGDEDRHRRRR